MHPRESSDILSVTVDSKNPRALLQSGSVIDVSVENIRYWIWNSEIHLSYMNDRKGCMIVSGDTNYKHYLREPDDGALIELNDTEVRICKGTDLEYDIVSKGGRLEDYEVCSQNYLDSQHCTDRYLVLGFNEQPDVNSVKFD